MARLTSLASVLAALDSPAGLRGAPSATEYGTRRPPPGAGPQATRERRATPVADPAGVQPRSEQPGYQVWESAWRQAEFYAAYAEMLETDRREREGRRTMRRAPLRWQGDPATRQQTL